MPISGIIVPASGPQSTPTPTAAREAFALRAAEAARAAEAGVGAGLAPPPIEHGRAGAGTPAGAPPPPPALGADGKPVESPPPGDEKYEAWRLESIARRERAATQERLAAKAERDTLAREKTAMDAREKGIVDREARLDQVEKRLSSYRYNPHLVLQDLAQYGVSFEMLAQAVAQGIASPDQIAAAEAAAARREVEEFRSEQSKRDVEDRERREKEQRDTETNRQRAEREARERQTREQATSEAEAKQEWQGEIRGLATRDSESYPILASRLDRGALDLAFSWAEEFLAKENRIPTNEEVLIGVESQLETEAAELAGLLSKAKPRSNGAATLNNGFRPAPAVSQPVRAETEAEKKARVVAQLDKVFGRSR